MSRASATRIRPLVETRPFIRTLFERARGKGFAKFATLPPGRSSKHARRPLMFDPSYLPYLALFGRPLVIAFTLYYVVKAVVLLAAGTVAMHTDNDKRRETCLEIMRIVCPGRPWPPRPP